MRKAMLAGLMLVAVMATVAAFGARGTLTWFSGTEDQSGRVHTATIDLDAVAGFPLEFTYLLPSETQTKDLQVKNVGNREADFYVQLVSDGLGTDFCNPPAGLDMRITELDTGIVRYGWGSICNLYPGHGASTIPLLADNVGAGGTRTFRVELHLSGTAGNAYQGADNYDTVHLIAVQYNGLAPIPDNDGGFTQCAWPLDGPASPCPTDDDDPNYP
jgi:hypothetical protein